MQCKSRLQISRMKNIWSVVELSGVAIRLAPPYGGLLATKLLICRIYPPEECEFRRSVGSLFAANSSFCETVNGYRRSR